MTYRRFAAVASKEIIQIMRDTRSLIIVVLMPIILVLLFGYGVSLDVKHVAVYVFDREGSQQSQDLLKRLQDAEAQTTVLQQRVDNRQRLESLGLIAKNGDELLQAQKALLENAQSALRANS